MNDNSADRLRAENDPKFYSRFKWLGLGALGFMAYCLYDGAINYPNQIERGKAFLEIAEQELPNDELRSIAEGAHGADDAYKKLVKRLPDFPEFKSAWEAKTAAEGWPAEPFEKLRTEAEIPMQYGMAVVAGLAGVWFITTVIRTSGRWFELNENGIDSRWGESFSLDKVTEIDKKKWRDKGIARVHYKDAKGRSKTFVVDNYKYHRKTTNEILRRIELGAGFDKITGGRPEPDPNAVAESQPEPEPAEA